MNVTGSLGLLKLAVTAMTATMLSLAAVGVLGASAAEAPTSTSPALRTVSVQGVATVAIGQSANVAEATAVYRQGMTDALTDGQAKAQFLTSGTGATLGAVQNIVEDGGYISCSGVEEEYLGEQPDFGSPDISAAAPAGISTRSIASPRSKPVVRKPAAKHRKKRANGPAAKRALASGCTLSAQVSLVYALS